MLLASFVQVNFVSSNFRLSIVSSNRFEVQVQPKSFFAAQHFFAQGWDKPKKTAMPYAVMLTGVGPKRAQAELVTHIIYLAQIVDDSVTVMSFAKLDLTPT